MSKIKTFSFEKENFNLIKEYRFGKNWPVVYVIENKKIKEVYIGETTSAYSRSSQHYKNEDRKKLEKIHIISDEEFNKSAALDIESWLIQYMSADGLFKIQNGNGGLQNHNYYNKEIYKSKFENIIWEKLKEKFLVQHDLIDLKNSDLFKYSPYKTLTDDQYKIAQQIFEDLKTNKNNTYIINGKPGTGKTILAVYLFKYLKEHDETKNLKIGLVVPMTSLRKTIGKVFKNIKGLKPKMVLGPNDVTKEKYDLLIIDEAHRLRRRKNITNYAAFDFINRKLGLNKEGNELDWIVNSSDHQIFFYDSNQSIKPSDIRPEDFKKIGAKYYDLISQMRIEAGNDYIEYIENIFDLQNPKKINFENYDLKLFENIDEMVNQIKEKDKNHGLSRMVAGYAWPWHTKKKTKNYDIKINGIELIWNSTTQDWVNSPNAINEVGCIHTVQGYDLNYVGVIIGPEFKYDKEKKEFIVDKDKYFDINGRNGVNDPEELKGYIINIYKTLLTRGIRGTYIYVVDKDLREYLKKFF